LAVTACVQSFVTVTETWTVADHLVGADVASAKPAQQPVHPVFETQKSSA
jgi:hypothetical protein